VVVLVAESSDSTSSALGSGFFVERDVIVTSDHVIKGATKILAKIVGQKRVYDASKIIRFDEERDLALLKVEGATARPLPLATSYRPGVGDIIYIVGNPEGLEGTFSQGIVSALRGTKYIQVSAPISHGSSGGPVLNTRGSASPVSY
jgi:S1-C subfamily serine protease